MPDFPDFSRHEVQTVFIGRTFYAFDSSRISGFLILTDDKQNIFI